MKNKILFFASLSIITFLAACTSNVDPKEDKPENKQQEEKFELTVNMPDPISKMTISQESDRVKLAWEKGDIINLLFVQNGQIKGTREVTVSSVLSEQQAKFEFNLPAGLTGEFLIFGVFGGSGMDADNNVVLPTSVSSAKSLADIQARKDVVLYFKSMATTASPNTTTVFQHIGSLINVAIKNSGTSAITDIIDVKLIGQTAGKDTWAFNIGEGGAKFNLLTESFVDNATITGNELSLKTTSTSLEPGETAMFWAWYPIREGVIWPELKLDLRTAGRNYITADSKPEKTVPPMPGRNYVFNAEWDGSILNFGTIDIINNEVAGGLAALVAGYSKKTITIEGELNATDLVTLKEMVDAGTLSSINIEKATLVAATPNWLPDYSFKGCTNLKHIVLPNTMEILGGHSLEGSGIVSIVLPPAVKKIGHNVFMDCPNLESVTLNEGLTDIGNAIFANTKLVSVNIPSTLSDPAGSGDKPAMLMKISEKTKITNIEVAASHPKYASLEGVVVSKDYSTLRYLPIGRTSYTAPEGIITLASYSMDDQPYLESLELPYVKTMQWHTIYKCPVLKKVVFGNLETIYDFAFDKSYPLLSLVDLSAATNLNFASKSGTLYKHPVHQDTLTVEQLRIKVASQDIKDQMAAALKPYVDAAQ